MIALAVLDTDGNVYPLPLDDATINRMASAAMTTYYRDPYDTREKPHLARWSGAIRAAITALVEDQ